jgi:PemK-like, MazF-like toxin of type II toxin-antitoxin system/Domain of unknown function (DUF4279)
MCVAQGCPTRRCRRRTCRSPAARSGARSLALKLEPTTSFLKGEPISPRVDRPRPEHGWLLCSEHHVHSRDTRRHLDWLLDLLEPNSGAFASLLSRGVSADIYSYWVSACGLGGPILSPLQLARRSREKRGDLWRADLGAHRPQEQTGRRPVVTWQSDTLNRVLQSVLVVPLTTNLDRARLAGTAICDAFSAAFAGAAFTCRAAGQRQWRR